MPNSKRRWANRRPALLPLTRACPTTEIVNLRHKLRDSKLELKVVKNTLVRRAATEAGKEFMAAHFDGPLAVVLGYDDVSAPARVLTQYISSSGVSMTVGGGFLADRWLSVAEVNHPGHAAVAEGTGSQGAGRVAEPHHRAGTIAFKPYHGHCLRIKRKNTTDGGKIKTWLK